MAEAQHPAGGNHSGVRYLTPRRVLAPLAAVISRVKAVRPRPPALLPAMPALLPAPRPAVIEHGQFPIVHHDHPGSRPLGKHAPRWSHPRSPLLGIAMIIAVDGHGVIGLEGGQPWAAAAHDRFVKRVTVRSPVIVGRRTWEALIEQAGGEPILPDQQPIVLSRSLHPSADIYGEDGIIAADVWQALDVAAGIGGIAYVLGGAQTFQAFSALADLLYVTRIPGCFPGDVFMERAWLDGFELTDWALADDESVEFGTYVRTRAPRDAV